MQIFWIEINKLKYKDFVRQITKLENQTIVFTPNPEILLKTKTDGEFKDLLNKASYLTPDGIGLYIAFQILDNKYWTFINILFLPYYFFNLFFKRTYLYKKYGDRICGSDLTKDLLEFAWENKVKVTIVDLYNQADLKKVESQKIFPELLKKIFPNLIFDYFIYNPDKKDEVIEEISKGDSKILFSTLGMKRQEQSVVEILEKCENIKLGLGVGSSFDYFIWFQKRAPKLWRNLGLEWFYRLLTGPRKLDRLKRLWNAIFVFTYEVLKSK